MTSVKDGAFYGGRTLYGDHVDARVEPRRPDLVQGNGAGFCPRHAYRILGLAFNTAICFLRDGRRRLRRPARLMESAAARRLQGDLRSVQGRQARGSPQDVLTGFLNDGRGAGPSRRRRLDKHGAFLVAGAGQYDLACDAGGEIGGAVSIAA